MTPTTIPDLTLAEALLEAVTFLGPLAVVTRQQVAALQPNPTTRAVEVSYANDSPCRVGILPHSDCPEGITYGAAPTFREAIEWARRSHRGLAELEARVAGVRDPNAN